MRRNRSGDDETNWRLRDNVTWYADQAKAVPHVAKDIASIPREWFGAVKEMVDEMRSDGQGAGEHPDRAEDRSDPKGPTAPRP
jgi:hypothetical protein